MWENDLLIVPKGNVYSRVGSKSLESLPNFNGGTKAKKIAKQPWQRCFIVKTVAQFLYWKQPFTRTGNKRLLLVL